ncbi:hypothetical protein Tco_0602111, partial [Tanacetum coccineum]
TNTSSSKSDEKRRSPREEEQVFLDDLAFVSYVQKQRRTNHKDFHHCLFACFLSQHEPKKISEAFLILPLFILCLDKVSTDHVKSSKPIRIHFNRPIPHAISSTDILNLQALISLTDDLSLRSNMAALESCPKHNMLAYLEKTEGNVEFHEVIDFLQRSYISHALTVSPVVSTTFVEQFWTSAKSKTINNVRHITAKVAGKLVSILEDSISTDRLLMMLMG